MPQWKPLIVPREHGVWGLLAGAALVGLPLAGDPAGAPLLISALAGIAGRQAAGTRAGGWRRGLVLAISGLVIAGGIAWTAILASSTSWLGWLAGAALCGGISAALARGRTWWSSAVAGIAFACLSGAIAAAGAAPASWVLLGVAALAAHLVSAVPLVRSQIRRDALWPRLALILHVMSAACAVGGCVLGIIPSVIPLVFIFGLARAMVIMDKRTEMSVSPARIGAAELAWLPVLAAGITLGLRGGSW